MRRTLTALLVTCLACLVAPQAPAARAATTYGSTTVTYDVPTRHGLLHLEVVHPTLNGQIVRAPEVLTISPYSLLGRNGDAGTWTPLGIARAYVDAVGTGDSGGCYDYGGLRERQSGFDAVEWIARQPWSSGRIGMLGGSYDGTTQYATAIEHPPHLSTIVPEAAILRWYDYAYSGGIRYTDSNEQLGAQGAGAAGDEGADTPLGFDAGFGLVPPLDPTSPTFVARATDPRPCDIAAHTQHGYSLTPDVDAFWNERDYGPGLASVTVPTLIGSNWGDWNVKQIEAWDAWHRLAGHNPDAHLWMGTRYRGHGTPTSAAYPGFGKAVVAWMQHWLQDVPNGIEKLPPVISQTADSVGTVSELAGPEPTVAPVTTYASGTSLVGTPDPTLATRTVAITGTTTESASAATYAQGGAGFVSFTSAPLAADQRVFGQPRVTVSVGTDRSFVTLAVSLLDIDPARSGTSTAGLVAFTRGWLDTRYRQGLDHQVRLGPNAEQVAVDLKPTDYIVRKGHRIVVLVMSEATEWAVPKVADPGCVGTRCASFDVGTGAARTSLTLPVVAPGSPTVALVLPGAPRPVAQPVVGRRRVPVNKAVLGAPERSLASTGLAAGVPVVGAALLGLAVVAAGRRRRVG